MTNKTSGKNVATEEDIKNVKEFIDYAQEVIDDMEYERPVDVTVYQKDLTSIQNILAEREQKDKRIQELEAKLLDMIQGTEIINKETPEYVKENYIPKQVIIDKIKEYDKKMEEDAGHPNWVITDRIVINVLQELLEGDAKK